MSKVEPEWGLETRPTRRHKSCQTCSGPFLILSWHSSDNSGLECFSVFSSLHGFHTSSLQCFWHPLPITNANSVHWHKTEIKRTSHEISFDEVSHQYPLTRCHTRSPCYNWRACFCFVTIRLSASSHTLMDPCSTSKPALAMPKAFCLEPTESREIAPTCLGYWYLQSFSSLMPFTIDATCSELLSLAPLHVAISLFPPPVSPLLSPTTHFNPLRLIQSLCDNQSLALYVCLSTCWVMPGLSWEGPIGSPTSILYGKDKISNLIIHLKAANPSIKSWAQKRSYLKTRNIPGMLRFPSHRQQTSQELFWIAHACPRNS